jgi:hypothetical protein
MSEKQKQILIELSKLTKQWAVRNQSYECAAKTRDIEKYLERSNCFSDSAEEFYNKIKLIFDSGVFDAVLGNKSSQYLHLEEQFELQTNFIFRQYRRQELIDQLFNDSDTID